MANREKEAAYHPRITVIIGTLNRPNVVLKLLEQLGNESKRTDLEVFVIDQSDKPNYDILRSHFPNRKGLALTHFETPNTCKYLNYGWQHATSDLILYLDDDVEITETTIPAHISAYSNPEIMGVAGRVLNDGEQTTSEKQVGKIIWYGAIFKKNFSSERQTFVDFPYGCNMSFRRETLKEVGGFDEKLSPPIFSYNEVDVGLRITKRWKNSIVFLPEALVYHHRFHQGGTRNNFSSQNVVDGNNFNYGYFLGKNFSRIENVLSLLRRLPYQLVKDPQAVPRIVKGFIAGKKSVQASH
ncbi:MAG: glycosyltransferase [Patescibacteria group bacterium]|jgi:GT2 family glycosyltransferase